MDRIVVPPNTIHKVRKPMNVGLLYQLVRYCYENDLRLLQALSDLTFPDNLYYVENDKLEQRIKEFISAGKVEIP
jgi:hypothetical protein